MKMVSVLFHPLMMATYCSTWLFFVFPQIFSPIPQENIAYFILMVFLTTAVIPCMSILFFKYAQKISSLEMPEKGERGLPFFSITAFYALSAYLFRAKLHISYHLTLMMVVVTLLLVVILIITYRYKISVHAAGIWGATGLLVAISMKFLTVSVIYSLSLAILVAGLTTASRLYLNRHHPHEVWSGAFLGFTFCFTGFYLFA